MQKNNAMKKYIYLNCAPPGGHIKVLAEKINLKKGLDLFIAKNPISKNWTITELKSGLAVSLGTSKKEVVFDAKEKMKKYSYRQIRSLIKKGIKLWGKVPA